jgi:hypothetical protein
MAEDPMDFESYIGVGHDVPFPGAVAHWSCRSVQVPVDSEEGTMLEAGSRLLGKEN